MQAHRGEVSCTVTTAQPLDPKMRAEVEKVLASFVDKTQVLKLEMKVSVHVHIVHFPLQKLY